MCVSTEASAVPTALASVLRTKKGDSAMGMRNARKGRVGALDVATIVVLGVAVMLLLRPGSVIQVTARSWLRDQQQQNALKRDWVALAATAMPLYAGNAVPDVIEFSDYECPFCRAGAAVVDSAIALGIRIAILHVPIASHPRARIGALTAICSGRSGQFAEIHHWLLTSTQWRSDSGGIQLPGSIDSPDRISVCAMSDDAASILGGHLAFAESLRIAATPTFVSRTHRLDGPLTVQNLKLLREGRSE